MSNLVDVQGIAEEYGVKLHTVQGWIRSGYMTPEISLGNFFRFDPEKVRKQLTKATAEKLKSAKTGDFQIPVR